MGQHLEFAVRYTTVEGVWSVWEFIPYWELPIGVQLQLELPGVRTVMLSYRDLKFEYKRRKPDA